MWDRGVQLRLDRLRGHMDAQNLDLAVVSDPKNVYYFTGLPSSPILQVPTYLFVGRDDVQQSPPHSSAPPTSAGILVTGSGNAAAAQTTFGGRIATFKNYDLNERMLAYPSLAAHAAESALSAFGSPSRIGVETWNLPPVIVELLKGKFNRAELADLSEPIQRFRMVKDQDELDSLGKSCELDDFAYSVARRVCVPGRSELDIYGTAQHELADRVGSFQFFSGDFVSGERALDLGGSSAPTHRVMREGETVVLDLWVTTRGYWADMCRTFVVGASPTSAQQKVHSTLLRALEAGVGMLKPGSKASDVYRAVHQVIAAQGWGGDFPHHAGHAVGLDAWERPFIIPGCDDELEEGMVIALEPGVYLKEAGAMRIENNYVVTRDGGRSLSHYPLDL